MKQACRVCKNIYPVNFKFFYKHPSYKTGFTKKCRTCENTYQRERAQTWYRDKHRAIQKKYKDRIRKELHDAYGNKCICCGESTPEFLELDHINGGGRQHRLRETRDIYSVAREEGYPKDTYRLLCSNCNHSLGIKGYCPHNKL